MTELCTAVPKSRSVSTAFLAFFVGLILSLVPWVYNQCLLILSILLFGTNFEAAMWKHMLLSFVGSVAIAFAWCISFKSCFSGSDDVADSLQYLGQAGFLLGYTTRSVYLGNGLDCCLPIMAPIIMVVWALITHVKIYLKAVKRRDDTADYLICKSDEIV
jgi:hypothetical protein